MRHLDVCAVAELPPGTARIVRDAGVAVCPRHGAHIDIRSGRPLTLPAVLPVETFPVAVDDGRIVIVLER